MRSKSATVMILVAVLLATFTGVRVVAAQDMQPGRGGGSLVESDPIATPMANTAIDGLADGSGVTNAAAFRTAIGAGAAWDWVQSVPTTADWPDAVAAGGADDVCITTVLGTGAKIKAGYESDCATPYGSVDRTVGSLRSVGAGDFRIAFRLQLSRPGVGRSAGSSVVIAGPAFVDGASAAVNSWYGVGLYLSSSTLLNSEILKLESTVGAARWTTYSAFSSALASPSWPDVDYVMERTGTTLNIYAAPSRGAGFLIATHTVTAGAGLIGLRSQVLFSSADEIDIAITGYRSGLTDLPW